MNTGTELDRILFTLEPISLKEVQKASLMRRKDSKFILSILDLPGILTGMERQYRVLEIDGIRSHPYLTHYYDTPELEMYHLHHRGISNRHKIRFRKYGTSDIHFLEVKRKNSRGVTVKNRVKTSSMEPSVLTTEEEFLSAHSPYRSEGMVHVLENRFNRITLVRHDQSERITLDFGLRFFSPLSDLELDLPGVSIAEIKYERLLADSAFNTVLKRSHILPNRFSKYAIGAAMLNPELKQNRFKEKVRKVNQINEQYLQIIKKS